MDFTIPWASLLGGMLLGVSAFMLFYFNGKVAGISGIVSGALRKQKMDFSWRILFILGMIAGGVIAASFTQTAPVEMLVGTPLLIVAGLLVGFGTKLGNGCTSGHGICGIGRLSKRSIAATCVFMTVAGMTTFVMLHVL
jgi:uncharacterized membrane protein YedE/YeeE